MNRRLLDEVFDVLAGDKWERVAEGLQIERRQPSPMTHALARHFRTCVGPGRKLPAQTFGESAIDAAVFFFIGNGEGENFLLGKIGKALHWCLWGAGTAS